MPQHPLGAIRLRLVWLLALPLANGLLTTAAHAQPRPERNARSSLEELPGYGSVVAGELLVKFRQGTNRAGRNQALAGMAAQVRHFQDTNLGPGGRRGPAAFDTLVHVTLAQGIGIEQAIRVLRNQPLVEYAEPNAVLEALATTPNDPGFPSTWGLHNVGQTGGTPDADIDMPEAWDLATGSTQVVVAVIDTGIDYTHPDLAPNIWTNSFEIPGNGIDDDGNGFVDDVHGYDFANGDGDPLDDHFHGTHCSGTIGAVGNNGIGVAGVNWRVKIMALKFLGSSGSGSTAGAISAIQYAINNGARVLSNSWGGSGYLQSLQDAIVAARQAGVLFVAAAGNSNSDTPMYPAAYDDVVAVAATDHRDEKASFSNYGDYIDVAAPGVAIYSTFPTYRTAAMGSFSTDYETISGTSMACPHVAGLAALLLARNEGLDPDQLETLIKSTADDLGDPGLDLIYGWGRINAYNALASTTPGTSPTFPTADITSPANGAKLYGLVEISGSASGVGFASYELEYSGPGTDWTTLTASGAPVDNGLLGSLDTFGLTDGTYAIRLTVTDVDGVRYYDVVQIEIENIAAELSVPRTIQGTSPISITGTAQVLYGVFQYYTLEYGAGIAPTTWLSDRFTLANGGASEVVDGPLGEFDPSGLSSGFYAIRLTVYGSSSSKSVQQLTFIDLRLRQGFPFVLDALPNGQPGAADLDGDGSTSELALSTSKGLLGIDGAAQVRFLHGTDVVYGTERVVKARGVALGELSGTPGVEFSFFWSDYARLYAGHWDQILPGFPVLPESRDVAPDASVSTYPMLYDVDGDGWKDVVLPSVNYYDGRVILNVVDRNGVALPGFPWVGAYAAPFITRAGAVADTDGDGKPEIFFTTTERLNGTPEKATLFALDSQGRLLPGFPLDFSPVSPGGIVELGDLALVDLDGDGAEEVVFIETSSNQSDNLYRFAVHALSKDGVELAGWPFTLEGTYQQVGSSTPEEGGMLAVGDVTGDGLPELVVAPNRGGSGSATWGAPAVRVLQRDGSQLFSISNLYKNEDGVSSAAGANGLSLVDLDRDGSAEILVNRSIFLGPSTTGGWVESILVYSGTGVVDRFVARSVLAPSTDTTLYPHSMGGGGATLSDIDGDGRLELLYAYAAGSGGTVGLLTHTVLYVWDLDTAFSNDAMEWPMPQGNIARTGEYIPKSSRDGGGGGGPDTEAPSVPQSVTAVATSCSAIALSWAASTDTGGSGLFGYNVYDGTSGGLLGSATGLSMSFSGLVASTTYAFQVSATDNAGNESGLSAAALAMTPACPDTTPPTVALSSPGDGDFVWGTVSVAATAQDDVGVARVDFFIDGKLLASDDTVPYSVSLDTSTLVSGDHQLAAVAVDAAGNASAPSSITVTVSLLVAYPAAADAFVQRQGPPANGGTAKALEAKSGSKVTYIKFHVDRPGKVQRALLKLYTMDKAGSTNVTTASMNAWDELGITWDNKPQADGPVALDVPPTAAGEYVVDVTALVNGAGPVTFVITGGAGKEAMFSSREADIGTPVLEVSYSQ